MSYAGTFHLTQSAPGSDDVIHEQVSFDQVRQVFVQEQRISRYR